MCVSNAPQVHPLLRDGQSIQLKHPITRKLFQQYNEQLKLFAPRRVTACRNCASVRPSCPRTGRARSHPRAACTSSTQPQARRVAARPWPHRARHAAQLSSVMAADPSALSSLRFVYEWREFSDAAGRLYYHSTDTGPRRRILGRQIDRAQAQPHGTDRRASLAPCMSSRQRAARKVCCCAQARRSCSAVAGSAREYAAKVADLKARHRRRGSAAADPLATLVQVIPRCCWR